MRNESRCTPVEVRGQFVGVAPLPPPRGSRIKLRFPGLASTITPCAILRQVCSDHGRGQCTLHTERLALWLSTFSSPQPPLWTIPGHLPAHMQNEHLDLCLIILLTKHESLPLPGVVKKKKGRTDTDSLESDTYNRGTRLASLPGSPRGRG